ncbi:amidohydrolase family protein [Dactylosporangium sp. NPDC000555]|uniref:amidohydrolase family protein n=1 Tax=Dactylosporangium sp. NPDC000555 TaxID=3154260 RepID=UPI0033174680
MTPTDGATRTQNVPRRLPEPEPRKVHYTVISVDDHVVEPPTTFEGRIPAALKDRAPRIVEDADGEQAWLYDGELLPNMSVHATVGFDITNAGFDPQRFDQMRQGCWDIHERVRDMDVNGIAASLCFPSKLAGFGGYRFSMSRDTELGRAAFEAYNDWHLEDWAGAYPDRIIPCQIPWLRDPAEGAEYIRRNAERGFRAVTFPDNPEHLGLPSVHSGHWDPLLRACAETGTVVCLHVGSASFILGAASDAPLDTRTVLFPLNSSVALVDWLYSMIPVRFPALKIMLAESGIGWVPSMLDRLRFCVDQNHAGYAGGWASNEFTPTEIVQRNFWFSSLEDPSGFEQRHRIGVDRILVESDYPHPDSTWPDTQEVLHRQLRDIDRDEVDRITYRNAAELFRFPVSGPLT